MPYPHHLHPDDGSLRTVCALPAGVCRHGFQLIEIIILKDEIYHDIDRETHDLQEHRNNSVPDGSAGRNITTIATDDTSRYLIDRYIDRYVNKTVHLMTAYLALPSPYAHRIANNHTKSWQEKSILISLPTRWPPHLIDTLRDAVHRFIVKGVEMEILSTTLGPSDPYVQLCAQESEEADGDITVNINTRYGTMSSIMP